MRFAFVAIDRMGQGGAGHRRRAALGLRFAHTAMDEGLDEPMLQPPAFSCRAAFEQ